MSETIEARTGAAAILREMAEESTDPRLWALLAVIEASVEKLSILDE